MADGTSFSIDLETSGGSGAESMAASCATLADRLTAAGAAATQAANAVKAGEIAYKQAETAAAKAATALEKIGLAAEAQKGKLAKAMEVGNVAGVERASAKLQALNARQAEAATKAASTAAAMNAEAASLDKLKTAAGNAATAQAKLSKASDASKAAAAAAQGSGKSNEIAEGLGKLGGPLGSIGQKLFGAADAAKKLGASLGDAGPYAIAAVAIIAVVAAAVAVTVALIAATAAVLHFGIEMADAARSSALLSDGIARSVKGGRELDAQIASLQNRVPATRDELLAMASTLANTGLRGKELGDALEEAAVKAAELKFGPDFKKELLSIKSQTARLEQNFRTLFSGLNIEKLLEGLSKIVALFDSTSASGQAIKVVFESLFQPLVDGLTALTPMIVKAFINFEIWVLKALIAIKPFGSKILLVAEACGVLALIITAVLVTGTLLLVGAIILLMLPLIAVIALVIYFSDEISAAGAAISDFGASIVAGAGSAFDWLVGKVNGAIDFLKSLSLADIGTAMIDGLVSGITSAGPKILAAITGLATGAISAAKKALGIASPSKVFAEIGMHTAAGMEEGVDGGSDGVQGSLEALVATPDAPAAAAPGAKGSAAGAGIVIQNLIIQSGTDDPKGFAAALRDELNNLLTQAGGSVSSAA